MPKSLPTLNEHAGMIAICRSRRHRSVCQVHLARETIDNDLVANADLNIEDKFNHESSSPELYMQRTDDKITSVELPIGLPRT